MNLFSERKKLEEQYKQWLKNNPNVMDCAFSVITFLDLQDRLKNNGEISISDKIKIKKLADYENAEEKGLLVILPVVPGETVYLIDNNTDACDECENFVVGYCEEYCKCNNAEYPQCAEKPLCEKQFLEVIEYKTNQKWILENKDDFGKSIFLTREEAEAALKKMQEGAE